MPKSTRTAEQLQQILIERTEAISDLRGLDVDDHRLRGGALSESTHFRW